MLTLLRSRLASRLWWVDAARRALATAVAIAIPYFGGALLTDVPWLTVLSAAAVGALASLATSLAGLPEAEGVNLPWWLAALERTVKTFGQALAAGFTGATLLNEVPWSTVLQAAAIAALLTLLRLILATLPNDPTYGKTIISLPVTNLDAGKISAKYIQPGRIPAGNIRTPKIDLDDDPRPVRESDIDPHAISTVKLYDQTPLPDTPKDDGGDQRAGADD